MQRRRWLLMLLLTLSCLASADLGSQTRAQDAADPRRRCTLSFQSEEMPERKAIRCAEWFIAVQGYTSAAPASDTALIVSDPYDLLESKRSVTYGFSTAAEAWSRKRLVSASGPARLPTRCCSATQPVPVDRWAAACPWTARTARSAWCMAISSSRGCSPLGAGSWHPPGNDAQLPGDRRPLDRAAAGIAQGLRSACCTGLGVGGSLAV
jgi:hypothetical protein